MEYINYYAIASKESNQDEFITWVLKNYNTNDNNNEIKLLSMQFICEFFNNDLFLKNNYERIKNLKVFKQRKMNNKIFDVTLEFEIDKKYYFLIIEDKINAELNNDLKRYKEIAEEYLKGRDYILKGIVYKSSQFHPGEIQKINDSGFTAIGKEEIKSLFLNAKIEFKNSIIKDYFNNIFRPYKDLPFSLWNQKKFYLFLEEYVDIHKKSNFDLVIRDGTKGKCALYVIEKNHKLELRIQVETFYNNDFLIKVPSELSKYYFDKKKKQKFIINLNNDKCYDSDVAKLIDGLIEDYYSKIIIAKKA